MKKDHLLEKLLIEIDLLELRLEQLIEKIERWLLRHSRRRPVKLVVHFDKPVLKKGT